MSRILSDRDIRKLIGTVIQGADERLVNPNGIELRLGSHVRFLSTRELREIPPDGFIQVQPGETALIASLEKIDFSKESVQKHFPGCMLMGWLTPTTTMVREGQMPAATKVDAGFVGQLNWGFRNSSYSDFTLGRGESIVKLTIELLSESEVPDVEYGKRDGDRYQNTEGILISGRKIPADIAKDRLIRSSFDKIDAKKQLREAGYPFNAIGSELYRLDEKFEIVSADVRVLTSKIESETKTVMQKMDENKAWLIEHVENLFTAKFTALIGSVIGAITLLYGVLSFLQGWGMNALAIGSLALILGILCFLVLWIILRRTK